MGIPKTIDLEDISKEMEAQYKRGFEDGLRAFAHWRNGIEMVGTSSEKPLKRVLEIVEKTWNYNPPKKWLT